MNYHPCDAMFILNLYITNCLQLFIIFLCLLYLCTVTYHKKCMYALHIQLNDFHCSDETFYYLYYSNYEDNLLFFIPYDLCHSKLLLLELIRDSIDYEIDFLMDANMLHKRSLVLLVFNGCEY
jgi:hypothetical protein